MFSPLIVLILLAFVQITLAVGGGNNVANVANVVSQNVVPNNAAAGLVPNVLPNEDALKDLPGKGKKTGRALKTRRRKMKKTKNTGGPGYIKTFFTGLLGIQAGFVGLIPTVENVQLNHPLTAKAFKPLVYNQNDIIPLMPSAQCMDNAESCYSTLVKPSTEYQVLAGKNREDLRLAGTVEATTNCGPGKMNIREIAKTAQNECEMRVTMSSGKPLEELPRVYDSKDEALKYCEKEIEGIVKILIEEFSEIRKHNGRKLLQAEALDYNLIGPGMVQEHLLWNNENPNNVINIRVRHFLVLKPSPPSPNPAPSSYKMCASFSPLYLPASITSQGCIDVNYPANVSSLPPPPPSAVSAPPAPPSPASGDGAKFTYQQVCSNTADQVWSMCTWVYEFLNGTAEIGTKVYFNDRKVNGNDVLLKQETIDACNLTGDGCPAN